MKIFFQLHGFTVIVVVSGFPSVVALLKASETTETHFSVQYLPLDVDEKF